jgi:hypothetical protein
MIFNFERNSWYENRILWRANQHNLFNKRCLRFDDLPEDKKHMITSKITSKTKAILVFMKDSDLWTVLTTEQVISHYDGKLHVANLDCINKDIRIVEAENAGDPSKFKNSINFIHLSNLNVTIWAPEGAELFALMSILKMFPLLKKVNED